MSNVPPPEPGPPSPTPPPTSPAPLDYGQSIPGYAGPPPDQDSKTMGMLAHLLGIFTIWLGPLIIWLIKRETSPFVNDQGKEALNWEITVTIGFVVMFILAIIVHFIPLVGMCLAGLLYLIPWIVNLIFAIQGAMAASKGIAYRYPFSLRLIK